jgi:hypothetical protein
VRPHDTGGEVLETQAAEDPVAAPRPPVRQREALRVQMSFA